MSGLRLRRLLYRMGGLSIGRGTILMDKLKVTGTGGLADQLRIGENCVLNGSVHFNLGGPVRIDDGVSIGMDCLFVTVGHRIGEPAFRAGEVETKTIQIGEGCWLAARVTVLPGVTIGPGTVVAAGAVVAKDLPANVLAAGVPARTMRSLSSNEEAYEAKEGG